MDCFVISPIGASGSDVRHHADQVLEFIIKEALEPVGYSVERADTISESGIITSQIIERVVNTDLVVADLTNLNPNVFYELAIRHVVGKPFIHLILSGQDIPFDVSASRTIFYSLDLAGARRAASELRKQAEACVQNKVRVESPVSVAIDLSQLSHSRNPTETALSRIESEITKMRNFMEQVAKENTRDIRMLQDFRNFMLHNSERSLAASLGLERPSSSWTEEREDTLKKMWAAGKSATEIAKELGGVTRNAVIGKIHRLGLDARDNNDETDEQL